MSQVKYSSAGSMINEWLKYGRLNNATKSLRPVNINLPPSLTTLLDRFEHNIPMGLVEEEYRRELLQWLLSRILRGYLKTITKLKGRKGKMYLYAAAAVTTQYLLTTHNDFSVRDIIENLPNRDYLNLLNWPDEWVDEVMEVAKTDYTGTDYFRNYRIRGINLLGQAIEDAVENRPSAYIDELMLQLKQEMKIYGGISVARETLSESSIKRQNNLYRRQRPFHSMLSAEASINCQNTASTGNPEEQEQTVGDELRSIGVELSKKLLNAKEDKVDVNDAISVIQGAIVLSAIGGGYFFAKWTSWDSITQVLFAVMIGIIVGMFSLYGRKRRTEQRRKRELTKNNPGEDRGSKYIGGGEEIG